MTAVDKTTMPSYEALAMTCGMQNDKLQQVRQGAREWKRQCKEARKALAEMTAVQEALLADNERLGDRLAKTLSREREQADAAAELAYELLVVKAHAYDLAFDKRGRYVE